VGFLIDTDLWIAIERRKLSVADIHAITKQHPVFLSPINVAEICTGIELVEDQKQKQQALAMLRRIRRKPLLRITRETAEVFGLLSAKLLRTGAGRIFACKTFGWPRRRCSANSRCSPPTRRISKTSRI